MHELPIQYREFVNLLVDIKFNPEPLIENLIKPIAKAKSQRLAMQDKNWRNHKVRSKKFKGLLGDLYDSVMV
jgi:hypothetical protein